MDIVTASPPVSPRVVAAILMIQKSKVTWGTLLHVSRARSFMSIPAWSIGEEALDPSHKPTTAAGGRGASFARTNLSYSGTVRTPFAGLSIDREPGAHRVLAVSYT